LPVPMLNELRLLANQRDVPYQSLIKIFLKERIDRELRKTGKKLRNYLCNWHGTYGEGRTVTARRTFPRCGGSVRQRCRFGLIWPDILPRLKVVGFWGQHRQPHQMRSYAGSPKRRCPFSEYVDGSIIIPVYHLLAGRVAPSSVG